MDYEWNARNFAPNKCTDLHSWCDSIAYDAAADAFYRRRRGDSDRKVFRAAATAYTSAYEAAEGEAIDDLDSSEWSDGNMSERSYY